MLGSSCQICFEEGKPRLALSLLKTGNGDVLRSQDCGHPVCQGCLAKHATARIEEQRVFGIRCPFPGCRNELYEQDLRKLVQLGALSSELCDRFADLRARDYTARAKGFLEATAQVQQDYTLLRRLWDTTRLCPRCSVIIEKSEGCNSFYCICGHHFNYGSAPRAVGSGQKHYEKVISLAEGLRIPVVEAEWFEGNAKLYFKAKRTAVALGLALEDAAQLHKQAQEGDEAARGRIRSVREAARAEGCASGTPAAPSPSEVEGSL